MSVVPSLQLQLRLPGLPRLLPTPTSRDTLSPPHRIRPRRLALLEPIPPPGLAFRTILHKDTHRRPTMAMHTPVHLLVWRRNCYPRRRPRLGPKALVQPHGRP